MAANTGLKESICEQGGNLTSTKQSCLLKQMH